MRFPAEIRLDALCQFDSSRIGGTSSVFPVQSCERISERHLCLRRIGCESYSLLRLDERLVELLRFNQFRHALRVTHC